MHINEEIVKEYYTLVEKCFVIENINFKVITERKDNKKGSGWSDIDLLAYNPKKNVVYDIEVKYRQNAPFHKGTDEVSSFDKVIKDFKLKERNETINKYTPERVSVQKIFITNWKAFSEVKREEYTKELKSNEIELKYFEDLFIDLKEYFEKEKKINSIVGQTLRLINNIDSTKIK